MKWLLIMHMLSLPQAEIVDYGWYLTDTEEDCNEVAHEAGRSMLKDGFTFDFMCLPVTRGGDSE